MTTEPRPIKPRVPRYTGDDLVAEVQKEALKRWNDADGNRPEWDSRGWKVRDLIGLPAGRLYYVEQAPAGKGGGNIPKPKDLEAFFHRVRKSDLDRWASVGVEEDACERVLWELSNHLRTWTSKKQMRPRKRRPEEPKQKPQPWLTNAKATLDALDKPDPEDPRRRPGHDGPAASLLRTLVQLAEWPHEVRGRDKDRDRRGEVFFAVERLLRRPPEAKELAWATILCGVVPNLRPATDPPTDKPRVSDVIIGEARTASQTLGRLGRPAALSVKRKRDPSHMKSQLAPNVTR